MAKNNSFSNLNQAKLARRSAQFPPPYSEEVVEFLKKNLMPNTKLDQLISLYDLYFNQKKSYNQIAREFGISPQRVAEQIDNFFSRIQPLIINCLEGGEENE